MARPRKHNRHFPRGMIHRHGAYYLVVKGRYTRLSDEYGPALIEYARLIGSDVKVATVADAISHYIQSSAKRLSRATIDGYNNSAKRLNPVFGHMALTALTPADVYRYLVEHGNVAANRDRALLSAAYSHARRIGAFSGDDPAKGLQYRNEEIPRDRYVTDEELATVLEYASEKLRCIIRMSYLTGMRQGDVLRIRMSDITDEGITYTPGKAGKRGRLTVVAWTEELRGLVQEANRLWRRFGRVWLFESRPKGRHAKKEAGPYTTSGVRALWRVARAKAAEDHPQLANITLHDFRAKAGSDMADERDAQALLTHADGKVTRRHYRRKAAVVKPVR